MIKGKRPGDADLSVMCTLSERDFSERRREIQQELLVGVERIEELSDGYELQFPGTDSWFDKLVQFIASERSCCSFFTFELIIPPDRKGISLRMRGGAQVKAALQNEFRTLNNEVDTR